MPVFCVLTENGLGDKLQYKRPQPAPLSSERIERIRLRETATQQRRGVSRCGRAQDHAMRCWRAQRKARCSFPRLLAAVLRGGCPSAGRGCAHPWNKLIDVRRIPRVGKAGSRRALGRHQLSMLMAGTSGIMGFVLKAYLSCVLPQYPVPCPHPLPDPMSRISNFHDQVPKSLAGVAGVHSARAMALRLILP